MGRPSIYAREAPERAVQMVFKHWGESQWSTMGSIASKIDCTGKRLHGLVPQAEHETEKRPGQEGFPRSTSISSRHI